MWRCLEKLYTYKNTFSDSRFSTKYETEKALTMLHVVISENEMIINVQKLQMGLWTMW